MGWRVFTGCIFALFLSTAIRADLVSHFSFDGDLLDPISGNDGTFVGADAATFVEGYDGTAEGAVSFDGVDDFVNVAQVSNLPLADHAEFSVAMWVNADLPAPSDPNTSEHRPMGQPPPKIVSSASKPDGIHSVTSDRMSLSDRSPTSVSLSFTLLIFACIEATTPDANSRAVALLTFRPFFFATRLTAFLAALGPGSLGASSGLALDGFLGPAGRAVFRAFCAFFRFDSLLRMDISSLLFTPLNESVQVGVLADRLGRRAHRPDFPHDGALQLAVDLGFEVRKVRLRIVAHDPLDRHERLYRVEASQSDDGVERERHAVPST